MKINKVTVWMVGAILLLLSSLVQAGSPVWTFTPVPNYPPTVSVSPGETATIKYTMMNQSTKIHTLVMTPIAGITQSTSAGNCSNPFTLTYHQTCILTLQVDGSALPGNIIGGPQVCQQGNSLQCYQPSAADSLHITKVSSSIAGISVSPSTLALMAYSGTPGYLTITNNSTTITATNIQATLPPSWTDVTEDAGQCTSVAPGSSCQLAFLPGTTVYCPESVLIKGSNTTQISATISVDSPSTTTLSASVSTLALAASGNAREITIRNVGGSSAYNVSYSLSPALPSGSTITPANCGTMATSATCVLTITPGATPSNTPSTLSIQGVNTNALTSDIYILAFGSIYQEGYVFNIDDTTAIDGSIGGTIASLTDNSSGIQWYNGSFVITGASSLTDGASNTTQIITVQGAGSYAASICANYTIDSSGNSPCATGTCYTSWNLPAICQMGPASNSSGCTAGTPNMADNLSLLLNCSGSSCLSGFYWSSTEYSSSPQNSSWFQVFSPGGASFQNAATKSNLYQVRCVRNITP
ncbi:MAG: DUF1566 domain-containing protein [Gammaproteobacteria bacterium]|nr:DUF1566 domain-containing protein [Gammaproteobacteria bacterium]